MPDAQTEALILRLRSLPEIDLIHHFKNEGTLLLFASTRDQFHYERFLAALTAMQAIASYHSWPPFSHSLSVPTYQPKTWLLSTL